MQNLWRRVNAGYNIPRRQPCSQFKLDFPDDPALVSICHFDLLPLIGELVRELYWLNMPTNTLKEDSEKLQNCWIELEVVASYEQ